MGFEKELIADGDGCTFPKKGQMVSVHYTGTLPDGTTFDSSIDRNKPFTFRIGEGLVVKGWDEGIQQMSLGERAILKCSPDYGYGKKGYPGVIPPHSELTFEIHLLKIS